MAGHGELKWSSWNDVVHSAYDRPAHETVLVRRICVPIVVALVAATTLVVVHPPFVCTSASGVQHSRLSVLRLMCWSVLAAVATAVLTATRLFR